MNLTYCESLTKFKRLNTRIVNIGNIPLGGNYPIRLQTMTNTNTLDTHTTVDQCIRCAQAGADYVRITIPTLKDAENLAVIKTALRKKGYSIPLIADVHFNPRVAEVAASIVEKVRINPGNYVDKKKFEYLEYSDNEYAREILKIQERLKALLIICKEHGTVIRIGVNHGSLSDRILSRFGDTPLGMVESAMEFLRIFESENFYNTVLSLKASNTRIMVQAYRLLVAKMLEEGMNYPLHLGVTEAGEGEDGRIKSAVGIGALLADGIGDTVRVSLTEDPEKEIPVAATLVNYFVNREKHPAIAPISIQKIEPFSYKKRKTLKINNIGGSQFPIVIADYNESREEISLNKNTPEYFFLKILTASAFKDFDKNFIVDFESWNNSSKEYPNFYPVFTVPEYLFHSERHPNLNFLIIEYRNFTPELIKIISADKTLVFILQSFNSNPVADQRAFFNELMVDGCQNPVIINRNYCEDSIDDLQIKSAADIGALLIDGLGDGIWLSNFQELNPGQITSAALGILQASRVRTSKTEYISCPSCGRTLFDLQSITARIREKTSHLIHLKIAIMGCIVNGPGEMADADYGYVGAGPGKVTLYRGKTVIKKNINAEDAVDELVQIIRDSGDWKEQL